MNKRFQQIMLCCFCAVLLIIAGQSSTSAQGQTETLVATAECTLTGNKFDEVGFTLSSPSVVTVKYDPDGTWWISMMPTGPMFAWVDIGKVIMPAGTTPAGATLTELQVALPAGVFHLHGGCSGPQRNRSAQTTIDIPVSPPTPPGPFYHVTARAHQPPSESPPDGWVHGYNDRLFYLTASQVVSFYPNPYGNPGLLGGPPQSNGWIADFNGNILWEIDKGTVLSRSTLALLLGGYCLHVDWAQDLPVQISDQWTLQFVGPLQPTDPKASTTAVFDPSGTSPQYDAAAFELTAPQVVKLSIMGDTTTPTYWIVDSTGITWYRVYHGLTQSGSAEVYSTGGTPPGRPPAAEGDILLPAGQYLLHVDAGGTPIRTAITVHFVGREIEKFPWPSQRDPCGARPGEATSEGGCQILDLQCHYQNIRRAIEQRIEQEIERQIAAYLEQMCGSAMLLPLLAFALILLRRV